MAQLISGLNAVTVHVRDVSKARLFYRDVLGLKEKSYDEKANRAVFELPDSPTILSMHVQAPGEEGREPGTVTGVVFRSSDPVAACAEIQRRGGTITMEPRRVELPNATFHRAAFADPDGNEYLISDRKD